MSRSTSEKLQFIRSTFGPIEISRDRINVAVKCPNCKTSGTNKKKLVLRIDTDQFHCWVCGVKGKSYLPLLKKYFPDRINEYKSNFASNKRHFQITSNDHESDDKPLEIPKNFILLANALNDKDPDIRATIMYVKSRGLTVKDMWHFKMGTCRQGKFRRRVILPSFDGMGVLNYYVGRAIDPNSGRKYINASVSKGDIIFNEISIDWKKELTLVEGPFDMVKCDENATCLLGSYMTSKMIIFRKIVKNQTPVLLALDPDAIKKSHNIAKLLFSYGISVRMMNIPKLIDVGDMTQKEFVDRKNQSHTWKLSDRLYHMISEIKSGSLL